MFLGDVVLAGSAAGYTAVDRGGGRGEDSEYYPGDAAAAAYSGSDASVCCALCDVSEFGDGGLSWGVVWGASDKIWAERKAHWRMGMEERE